MSEGFDAIADNVRYRLVYGAAHRAVESAQRQLHWMDLANPRDVAKVRRELRHELGDTLDRIDPAIVTEALEDAMSGRRPRW